MDLETLTCNGCGAPLRVPDSANYVTCNHCSTQLVVRRTDGATFTEQLELIAEKTDRLSERVDDLAIHSELAALDRQWELERTGYVIRDKHGNPHLPSAGGALGGGIMIAVFGTLWTVMAIGITSSAPSFGPFALARFIFPAFGICFVIGGIAMSVNQYAKAGDYRAAERRYRLRRAELLGKPDSSGDDSAQAFAESR